MSDGKGKFKVEDRVRFDENYGAAVVGDEGTVTDIDGKIVRIVVDAKGEHSCYETRVSLVAASPIRTVTRREIVPGSYGRLGTTGVGEIGPSGTRVPVRLEERFYTADDLREAAHLFNQLAEVLEENAASGKAAA